MMINKLSLVHEAAKRADLSQRDTENVLNALLDITTEALHNHNGVRLIGFGSLKTAHRKKRNGRNPQTGKKIKIPARDVPKFTAGKDLRHAVDANVDK